MEEAPPAQLVDLRHFRTKPTDKMPIKRPNAVWNLHTDSKNILDLRDDALQLLHLMGGELRDIPQDIFEMMQKGSEALGKEIIALKNYNPFNVQEKYRYNWMRKLKTHAELTDDEKRELESRKLRNSDHVKRNKLIFAYELCGAMEHAIANQELCSSVINPGLQRKIYGLAKSTFITNSVIYAINFDENKSVDIVAICSSQPSQDHYLNNDNTHTPITRIQMIGSNGAEANEIYSAEKLTEICTEIQNSKFLNITLLCAPPGYDNVLLAYTIVTQMAIVSKDTFRYQGVIMEIRPSKEHDGSQSATYNMVLAAGFQNIWLFGEDTRIGVTHNGTRSVFMIFFAREELNSVQKAVESLLNQIPEDVLDFNVASTATAHYRGVCGRRKSGVTPCK